MGIPCEYTAEERAILDKAQAIRDEKHREWAARQNATSKAKTGTASKVARIAEEAPFAKIVRTNKGASILIGGVVYTLVGPDRDAAAEAIVSVLRGPRTVVQASQKAGLIATFKG